MSNGYKLELVTIADGSVQLAFWDWLHGEDRIYVLYPDGSTAIRKEDELYPVNLSDELRELVHTLDKRNSK